MQSADKYSKASSQSPNLKSSSHSRPSGGFFLLFLRLKLPTLCLGAMWLAEPCLILVPLLPQTTARSAELLSVGECKLPILRLDMLELRLRLDAMPKLLG